MSLECESTLLYVYDRGGLVRYFEITSATSIIYERLRDAISTANIKISTEDTQCCDNLAKAECGRHELVIVRNGMRVWEGPIVRIGFNDNFVEIEAHDVWHYVYRTIIKHEYNNTYPHNTYATERASDLLNGELNRTDGKAWENISQPANILPFLDVRTETDTARTSRLTLPYERTVWEEIDEMASTGGIDYTCVGRSMIIFDVDYELGRSVQLTDRDIEGTVIVTEYGMNLATFSATTTGDGNYGYIAVEDDYYGPWEILDTAYGAIGVDTIQCSAEGATQQAKDEMVDQARRNISGHYPTPVVVRIPDNSALNPDTGLTIADLVPGVRIPVVATTTCRKVRQLQKLDSVTFTITDQAPERITIVLSPAPGAEPFDESSVGTS